MKIIIGFEESQTVCKAFRALGHEAYSCDLQPCSGGKPEWHIQGDIFEVLDRMNFDLGIFHPPCTYLTTTANKWLKDQPARKSGALVGEARREARREAVSLFMRIANCNIPKIAIENPVGAMSSEWRKPDQIFQPMDFGHVEPKRTCLWLKGLPLLKPTHYGIEPEYHTTKSGARVGKWFMYADRSEGQAGRAKIRSKTFQGIADAMAAQWGGPTTIQQQALIFPSSD